MKAIFVTATDTGAGKTIVTGLLARYLLEKGYSVVTQKWVQTGTTQGISADIKLHLEIMGRRQDQIKEYSKLVSPYIFKAATSPHLASRLENKRINLKKIIKSFKLLSRQFDFVLVEGIGGALVPLNNKQLVVDIVKKLNLPVLVVAQNKLGVINHTLLTIEALRIRKIKILGIVFNNISKTEDRIILQDNPRIIETLTKQRVFGVLPKMNNYGVLYQKFIPAGEKILNYLLKTQRAKRAKQA